MWKDEVRSVSRAGKSEMGDWGLSKGSCFTVFQRERFRFKDVQF